MVRSAYVALVDGPGKKMLKRHIQNCWSGKRVVILLPVFCLCSGFLSLSLSFFLLVSLAPCPASFAVSLESLPSYHYLVNPLEDLRIRGDFPDLDVWSRVRLGSSSESSGPIRGD